MLNKIKYSCISCREEFTTNNLTKHTERCLVKGGKISYYSIGQRDSLVCLFCDRLCDNQNSLRNHERLCSKNPDKQVTPFHDVEFQKSLLTSHKRLNQFSKARKLGLPIPVVSEDTRKKMGEASNKGTHSYASKESLILVDRLLNDFPELVEHRLYYFSNPHEYVLNSNGNKYCYDFTIKNLNLMIEYNGTKWHPKSRTDEEFRPIFESQGTRESIFDRDQHKKEIAELNGFTVLYCWSDNVENDYEKIKSEIQNRLNKV